MTIKLGNNGNLEFTKLENSKRALIRKYSNENSYSDVNKINISLVYIDNIYLKFLKFPKSIYRQYFLHLLTNETKEKIHIKRKDKNEVKEIIKLIYGQ